MTLKISKADPNYEYSTIMRVCWNIVNKLIYLTNINLKISDTKSQQNKKLNTNFPILNEKNTI